MTSCQPSESSPSWLPLAFRMKVNLLALAFAEPCMICLLLLSRPHSSATLCALDMCGLYKHSDLLSPGPLCLLCYLPAPPLPWPLLPPCPPISSSICSCIFICTFFNLMSASSRGRKCVSLGMALSLTTTNF